MIVVRPLGLLWASRHRPLQTPNKPPLSTFRGKNRLGDLQKNHYNNQGIRDWCMTWDGEETMPNGVRLTSHRSTPHLGDRTGHDRFLPARRPQDLAAESSIRV